MGWDKREACGLVWFVSFFLNIWVRAFRIVLSVLPLRSALSMDPSNARTFMQGRSTEADQMTVMCPFTPCSRRNLKGGCVIRG